MCDQFEVEPKPDVSSLFPLGSRARQDGQFVPQERQAAQPKHLSESLTRLGPSEVSWPEASVGSLTKPGLAQRS